MFCFYVFTKLSASWPGEEELSYAYDGRGRKVSGGREEEFGEPLSDGDIIGCYLVSDYLSAI